VSCFTITGTSHADEIAIAFETSGVYGREIYYSYDPTGGHVQPLLSGNTTAGRLDWTVMSEGPVAFGGHVFNNGDQFSSFSSELTGFVTPGATYTYDSVAVKHLPGNAGSSPLGFFRAGLLQDLFDRRYAQAIDGNTLQAAAFQVAVWEIVNKDRLAELGSGGGPSLSELLVVDDGTFIVGNGQCCGHYGQRMAGPTDRHRVRQRTPRFRRRGRERRAGPDTVADSDSIAGAALVGGSWSGPGSHRA